MFLQHRNAKTVTAHNSADNNRRKNPKKSFPIRALTPKNQQIIKSLALYNQYSIHLNLNHKTHHIVIPVKKISKTPLHFPKLFLPLLA